MKLLSQQALNQLLKLFCGFPIKGLVSGRAEVWEFSHVCFWRWIIPQALQRIEDRPKVGFLRGLMPDMFSSSLSGCVSKQDLFWGWLPSFGSLFNRLVGRSLEYQGVVVLVSRSHVKIPFFSASWCWVCYPGSKCTVYALPCTEIIIKVGNEWNSEHFSWKPGILVLPFFFFFERRSVRCLLDFQRH